MVDEFVKSKFFIETVRELDFDTKLKAFKCLNIGDVAYPINVDDHHALIDAKWNHKLHDFLKLANNEI